MTMNKLSPLLVLLSLCVSHVAYAQQAQSATSHPAPLIVKGTVPDEASRASLVADIRKLYTGVQIIDQLQVGGVTPPPNWTKHVSRLLHPDLKQIHGGQLQVQGTRVSLSGKVANEAIRQQVASTVATALTPAYVVRNALSVDVSPQAALDSTLGERVVEFESGSAVLTPKGTDLLDEMAARIIQLGINRVQVVGHTDSAGDRLANIGLSLERANAVRDYLIEKGIPSVQIAALGAGPDRPIGNNDTAEGRARNRRIEFRIGG